MAWFYLIIAGLSEVAWAVALKYCDGFKINLNLIIVAIATLSTIVFLSLAMKDIPVGISYAIFVAIGIIGITLYGLMFFGDTISMMSVLFLFMILIGIIGLKFVTVSKL